MPLISKSTALKDLKYGKDRMFGGSSNQPYITKDINSKPQELGFLNQDFILRGGSRAVQNSFQDVERLGRYFTDITNPAGLFFIAKQNLLSRTAVKTQANEIEKLRVYFDETRRQLLTEKKTKESQDVYTPLSTLIEAGGVAFGLHVNKQGLNPLEGPGSLKTYSNSVDKEISGLFNVNRLVKKYNENIINISADNNISTYGGGPGSDLGIGQTYIRFADQRTGVNNEKLKNSGFFEKGYKVFTIGNSETKRSQDKYGTVSLPIGSLTPGNIWKNYTHYTGSVSSVIEEYFIDKSQLDAANENFKKFDPKNLTNAENVYSQEQIKEETPIKGTGDTIPKDFRTKLKNLKSDIFPTSNKNLYDKNKYYNRTQTGDPGNRFRKNLTSYTNGHDSTGAASLFSYDKINIGNNKVDDLINFKIGVYDFNSGKADPLQFRAYLNNITDTFNSEWEPTRYIGRAENFYTYSGFDRKVSLSWTVAAQSRIELLPIYNKLNKLASFCAPNYSNQKYMRGNIATLTIGDYFINQPGIIQGFSYEMNDENATWEIGIDDEGDLKEDIGVKRLPHLIKVNGFNFVPIHTFVPQTGGQFLMNNNHITTANTTNNANNANNANNINYPNKHIHNR